MSKTTEIDEFFHENLFGNGPGRYTLATRIHLYTAKGNDMPNRKAFEEELRSLINRHSMEAEFGDTPDFILCDYIMHCLDSYSIAVNQRSRFPLPTDSGINVPAGGPIGVAGTKPCRSSVQQFPCVESTAEFSLILGCSHEMRLRVWRDEPSVDDATARGNLDIADLIATRAANDWSMGELAKAVAKLGGVSAVQVSDSLEARGLVIYTEWP